MSLCIRVVFGLAMIAVSRAAGASLTKDLKANLLRCNKERTQKDQNETTRENEINENRLNASHEESLSRNKRQIMDVKHFGLPERKEVMGNNFKYVPDFWPGVPSPPPGPSLNDIIFESDDGEYHGPSRRYKGAAADVLRSKEPLTSDILTEPPEPYVPVFQTPISTIRDGYKGLRALQSRINRQKLMTTVTGLPRVTTPFYAKSLDVNMMPRNVLKALTDTRRMMMGEQEDKTEPIPQHILDFIQPKVEFQGTHEVEPVTYNPETFAKFESEYLRPPPKVIPPSSDRPLKYFNYLYGTTTKRRPRTRRTKVKTTTTTMRIIPAKDDMDILEEEDEDYDYTTPQSSLQTQDKQILSTKMKYDYIDDITTTTVRKLMVKNKIKDNIGKTDDNFKTEMPEELDYEPNTTTDVVVLNTPKFIAADPLKSGARRTDVDTEFLDTHFIKEWKEIKPNNTFIDETGIDIKNVSDVDVVNKDLTNLTASPELKESKHSEQVDREMPENLKSLLLTGDESFDKSKGADYFDPDSEESTTTDSKTANTEQ